ncbi:MAG TPA: DUF4912 domain-containing protein [Planctomycetaceae bacterium]|nr:DUF4912 domain-containing protein [Planctomycetaceae bacterium]
MTTASALKDRTVKDLAKMAKKMGISGCTSMRKDELIKTLVREAKKKSRKATAKAATRTTKKKPATKKVAARTTKAAAAKPKTNPTVSRKIQKANANRETRKDLSRPFQTKARKNGEAVKRKPVKRPKLQLGKDRIVVLVRGPYWLHAIWEVSRQSVMRAQAAMAEHWHTAKPVLRLCEIDKSATTSAAETVIRDIEIHSGVKNWYIDVNDPPKSYRVLLGYKAANGKFHALSRSNAVTTPKPGSCDAIDENWSDVAEDYDRVFAMSGGYEEENAASDLRELFEERLRRPMGEPMVTRFGNGAERALGQGSNFAFEVDAEMIIYGATNPDAHVSLTNEPVKLRPDGTFTVRLAMPDRRQVLPVVASSADGVEQRTVVLAIERNTKIMEPMLRDSAD